MTTLADLANEIQTRKHEAQILTAQCASHSDWESEAYWRAFAEGLQKAEDIARKYAEANK